jgi:4-hydroxy-3-methylbut-2-enyl diphosphate reductase
MALREITEQCNLILVVGDPTSSNSNRLREAATKRGISAFLINGPDEIKEKWLHGVTTLGLTAGASTPEDIVTNCINRLIELGIKEVEEVVFTTEDVVFQIPRQLM